MTTETKRYKKLPKESVVMQRKLCGDGLHFVAAFYEYPEGYAHPEKYLLSDFPNNLASVDDFKRFGIDILAEKSRISKIAL